MRIALVPLTYVLIALTILRTSVAQDVVEFPGRVLGASRPIVTDLDNNPINGLETVIATQDGTLQAVKSDGSILWSVRLPNASCTATSQGDKSYSSPVVGELFGDGIKYVVVGFGGFRGKICDGGVAAYRATNGRRRWVFSLKKWAKLKQHYVFRHAVYGTPRIDDVDGDGKLEVGFGSFDRHIYLLNANGSVRWYAVAADTVFSSPVFADVTGDGKKEMIISTDISRNDRLKPPTPNGGYVYALNAAIKVPAGTRFGFRDGRLQVWRAEFDQVMQASPVVGNVLPSSPGVEVIVGSGCFFPQEGGERRGKWFKVLSGRTGAVLKTLSVSACTPTAPALVDVDRDGRLDVVGTVSGSTAASGDGDSHLIAWSPTKNKVLWDVVPLAGTRTDAFGGHYNRTPVIADLSGDGRPEILITYSTDVLIFNTAGAALTCDSSPCTKPLMRAGGTLKGSVAVADTDGDGVTEILAVGRYNKTSCLIRWDNPLM